MRNVICLSFLALATPALADEISGDWCGSDGGHIRIEGDSVRTPGGQQTHGIYSRHLYEFMIPEGETYAGKVFVMRQLSEELAIVVIEGGAEQEWRRCVGMS